MVWFEVIWVLKTIYVCLLFSCLAFLLEAFLLILPAENVGNFLLFMVADITKQEISPNMFTICISLAKRVPFANIKSFYYIPLKPCDNYIISIYSIYLS